MEPKYETRATRSTGVVKTQLHTLSAQMRVALVVFGCFLACHVLFQLCVFWPKKWPKLAAGSGRQKSPLPPIQTNKWPNPTSRKGPTKFRRVLSVLIPKLAPYQQTLAKFRCSNPSMRKIPLTTQKKVPNGSQSAFRHAPYTILWEKTCLLATLNAKTP